MRGTAKARAAGALIAATIAAAAAPAPAPAARPFDLGFTDPGFGVPGVNQAELFALTSAAGAKVARVQVAWVSVAPTDRPGSFNPRDPADPSYRWTQVDAAVREAAGRNLAVVLMIFAAPSWAEGAGNPGGVQPGSWRPDPRALADFIAAAAQRYSGRFADPANPGSVLPRVRRWQIWNEPNLAIYLAPQWTGSGKRLRLDAPAHYRKMLNAAYTELKARDRHNVVVGAGTAPFGDHKRGGSRTAPLHFDA